MLEIIVNHDTKSVRIKTEGRNVAEFKFNKELVQVEKMLNELVNTLFIYSPKLVNVNVIDIYEHEVTSIVEY